MELEEIFRSKLENAEIIPGTAVRQSLMRKLAVREFMRFNPVRFNIYYLGVIAAAGIAAAFLLLSRPDSRKTENTDIFKVEKEGISDTVSIVTAPATFRKKDINKPATSTPAPRGGDNSRGINVSGIPDTAQVSLSSSDTLRRMASAGNISEKTVILNIRKRPSASFVASSFEGCIPMKVKFTNTSVAYDSCRWYFGDGGSSSSVNPEWIYDSPGTYRVILNVYGTQGVAVSATTTITVFPKPLVRFEVQPLNPSANDDVMQFINYSNGAVRYRWDLGDGTVSADFEPVHTYDRSDRYNIKLTAWSEHGCVDSVAIINAFGGSGYYIRFPNAFIPNKNGPTGGYYNATSDASAHIFHPVTSGVVEYQLRIFSRNGLLIFESNDVNIGWDGYNKGNLCEPGVYIWKVRGTYKNGETFVKMGDVTLLRDN